MPCSVPAEVDQAIKDFLANKQDGDALILSCDKKSNQFTVVEKLSGASPEDVAYELPESVPRFVLHQHVTGGDNEIPRPHLFFIYYNPLSCSIELKRLYGDSRAIILEGYTEIKKFAREVELNDGRDFNATWYKVKLFGLQGKMGAPLPGQRSTGGYDGRL